MMAVFVVQGYLTARRALRQLRGDTKRDSRSKCEGFGAQPSLSRARTALCGSHRGTSLIRKRTPVGSYRRPLPRVLGGS